MTDHVDTTTKQFTITRVFDAPRAAIWHAWTDPDEAAAWWHPRNVTTPRDSVELDVRPGGRYRYTMIGPDGTEYPTVGLYREVVEPERLVFTWASPGDPDDAAPVITVTLAEHGEAGEQTHMTFELTGWDGEPGDGNVYDGWSQAFDELDGRLAPTTDGAH
jgi:uncharacterized protein YndB with AHSA1/START domain